MPELLLSSLSAKEPAFNKASTADYSNKNTEKTDQASAFTHTLSSVVNQSKLDTKQTNDQEQTQKIVSSIEALSKEVSKIEGDSEALSELKALLNGQSLSTQGLNEENLGLTLPEFLNQLQKKIDALNEFINTQENFSVDELSGLEFALMQLNQVISDVMKKQSGSQSESAPALLSFSFNSGSGRGGSQWQQYDPQQMSQNGQLLSGDQQSAGLLSEQMVSKTDRAFQLQMEQLTADKTLDVNDKTSLLEATTDVKDKAVSQFSDIQLRAAGDGLKQYTTSLTTPVNAQNWSDELSQKIVWFSGRNISAAEMHLNPAELGPIDVKINVQNDVASITFNVSNTSVKDLLESSVVRLREMMEANGVNVGEVNIDSDSREQSQQQDAESGHQGLVNTAHENSELGDEVLEQVIKVKETNLVDYFV